MSLTLAVTPAISTHFWEIYFYTAHHLGNLITTLRGTPHRERSGSRRHVDVFGFVYKKKPTYLERFIDRYFSARFLDFILVLRALPGLVFLFLFVCLFVLFFCIWYKKLTRPNRTFFPNKELCRSLHRPSCLPFPPWGRDFCSAHFWVVALRALSSSCWILLHLPGLVLMPFYSSLPLLALPPFYHLIRHSQPYPIEFKFKCRCYCGASAVAGNATDIRPSY